MAAAITACLCACPKSVPPCAYVDRGPDAGRVAIVSGACFELACPIGSVPTRAGRCECNAGLSPLLGACVSQEMGDDFCGASARFANGACTTHPCAPDQALDLESGACLPRASANAVSRLKLEDDEHASCHTSGRVAVASHGALLCMQPASLCGRGARDAACAPAACEAGEVEDESSGRCARIVKAVPEGYVVDVGAWTRAVLGPDGGAGTRVLCSPLVAAGEQPLVYGRVDFRVDLSFPDNDVSLVAPNVVVQSNDGRAVPQPLATNAVLSLVRSLRMLGGVASAGVVSAHVVCDLAALQTTMAAREGDSGLH